MLNLKHSLMVIFILSFLAACGGGGSGNELTAPAAPSQVTAASESNAITVSWKDNSNNETGFVIYREELDPATLQVQAFTVLTEKPANSTSHRDTISTEDINKTFRYAVSAKNSKGENPTDLSLTSTNAVQATPPLGNVRLSISRTSSGAGQISSSPEGINCDYETGGAGCSFVFKEGTTVTLSVAPAEDSEFTGWTNLEGCTGVAPCSITLNEAKTIEIALVRTKATIAVTKSGTGLGIVRDLPSSTEIDCGSDCSASGPASGYTLVLEAIADATTESIFAGWQGCPTVEGADGRFCRVTQTGPGLVTVDAIFNLPPPVVNRFEATPAKIIAGEPATLFWGVRTLGNTDVSLSLSSQTETQEIPDIIAIADKGLIDSLEVNPTETTTYTLVANSASGSSEEAVAIVSIGDATSISFTASDDPDDGTPTVTDITATDSVTFNWTLAGEAPLSSVLTKTVGTTTTTLTTSTLVTDTFSEVTGETATYTLTVIDGLGGTTSESLTVFVGPAPSISAFAIEGGDDTVASGSSVTLNWSIPATTLTTLRLRENATVIPLAVDARTVTRTLTSDTDAPTTYSYELVASNAFGSSAPSVLSVQAGNPVNLASFSAPESVIALGEAVPLSWVVAGSEPITFSLSRTPPFGTAPTIPTGSRAFSNTPAATGDFTYTLTASNAFGTPQSLSFDVKVEPVIITDFKAATNEVALGSPVNLSWDIRGSVSSYTLTRNGTAIPAAPGTLLSTARSYPDTPLVAGTYTYALSANNASGSFLAPPITVVVQASPPVVAP